MPLNGSLEASSIYLNLNTRPQAGTYHWGLTITDAHMNAALHHASNRNGPWMYEERIAKPEQSMSLIVLLLIGKVKNHARMMEVIKGMPADGSPSQRTGEPFSCITWAKDVLVSLHESGEIVLPGTIDELEITAVKNATKYAPSAETGQGATVININERS
ncbi:hypothetical protein E4U30_000167 [Claviceps sp. LM220 group G6]|nr:hypothetical protein E4U15_007524 [Claviceps sp. LM218 group G6]KAG6088897.1 hypothetical protein E4U30_000167 [Claviceps sp. LM220 group G6]KAG6090904.1 hypothetical protein E4U31_007564 [Claviceps sp. LM219 group G6]